MPTFLVSVPFSGYSRGDTTYRVNAETEEEAIKNVKWSGEEVETNTVRDDRDHEFEDAYI